MTAGPCGFANGPKGLAIVFDLDGTPIETAPLWGDAPGICRHAWRRVGQRRPVADDGCQLSEVDGNPPAEVCPSLDDLRGDGGAPLW